MNPGQDFPPERAWFTLTYSCLSQSWEHITQASCKHLTPQPGRKVVAAELPEDYTIVAGSSQSVRRPVGNVTVTFWPGKGSKDQGSFIHSCIHSTGICWGCSMHGQLSWVIQGYGLSLGAHSLEAVARRPRLRSQAPP